jgi:hypothetical protein
LLTFPAHRRRTIWRQAGWFVLDWRVAQSIRLAGS